MSISPSEMKQEEKYLERVKEEIRKQLEKVSGLVGEYRKEAIETKRQMWEEYARYIHELEDALEIKPQLDEMRREDDRERFYSNLYRKLDRMKDAPYFARMDFQENGSAAKMQVYIGIAALFEEAEGIQLIFDWRAPIASLYYDDEMGDAAYHCPSGIIAGKILLKRQFQITHGQFEYLFDSSVKIDDPVLQKVISQSGNRRMKTIVTTIQREQNQAIRDEEHSLLLVTGPAGSGKTSIALHRAAYFLYKQRDTLKACQIMIFSPHPIFSDYIANVLPELGEDNILRTTFQDYAKGCINAEYILEDRYQQLESLYSKPAGGLDIRMESSLFKSSKTFVRMLDQYLVLLEKRDFHDVYYGDQLLFSEAEAKEWFTHQLTYLPIGKRLLQLKKRFFYRLEPFRRQRAKEIERELLSNGQNSMFPKEIKAESRVRAHAEFQTLVEEVERMLAIDEYQSYLQLFADDRLFLGSSDSLKMPETIVAIRKATVEMLQEKHLNYEDLAPFLYLQGQIFGFHPMRRIRHLIVDEAQDYTWLQYQLIRRIFPQAMLTVLGDANQAIHPHARLESFADLSSIFCHHTFQWIALKRSYRSTDDINRFGHALLGRGPYDQSAEIRPGSKPLLIKASDFPHLVSALEKNITSLQANGMQTIAIICKTAVLSFAVFQMLQKRISVTLITDETETFDKGVVCIPVYLAKGLEYDAVIILEPNTVYYNRNEDREILYTACTRAMHRLTMIYTGELTLIIQEIDPLLYSKGGG